jgi:hypothetical protein
MSTRELLARLVIAMALIALGFGTFGGSAPTWPNSNVYAIAAWVTASVWFASIVARAVLRDVADAALLTLAVMRAGGYAYDLVIIGEDGLFAAVAAWTIVAALSARPLRSIGHHHQVK